MWEFLTFGAVLMVVYALCAIGARLDTIIKLMVRDKE